MAIIDGAYAQFVRKAARLLRDLALRAPEASNELRRFADELEEWTELLASDPEK